MKKKDLLQLHKALNHDLQNQLYKNYNNEVTIATTFDDEQVLLVHDWIHMCEIDTHSIEKVLRLNVNRDTTFNDVYITLLDKYIIHYEAQRFRGWVHNYSIDGLYMISSELVNKLNCLGKELTVAMIDKLVHEKPNSIRRIR